MLKTFTYEEALATSLEYFGGDELPAKTFLDKYALRNEKRELLESNPDMMHRRLAKEFARIEKNKFKTPLDEETIYNYFKNFSKIIPQGSPMYGIGNPYVYVSLSNCVYGETLVYTTDGLIKMKDIKPGMSVLTHQGRFKKVLRHWSNGIKETYTLSRTFGDKRPNITDESAMSRFAAFTPDHKIYTKSGEWKTVVELLNKNSKDIAAPTISCVTNVPDVLPLDKGRHISVDKDFLWILGLYLAEGSLKKLDTNHPSTYFTLNIHEEEYVERIQKFCQNVLGSEAWVQYWDKYNFIQVNIFDPTFALLLDKLCNHGFDKKRVPQWIYGLEIDEQKSFIDGFMCGDGTNYSDIDDDYNFFCIANPTLAYELGLVCRQFGKNVRFNFLNKGKLIKHRTVSVTISNKEDKINFIKSPVAVEVYDMEVEEDHSFVAGDIVCHNCFVIASPTDSYGGIFKTDQEMVQLMKRRGGVGLCLSELRPEGMAVSNSAGNSTGAVSFAHRYSNSCREVAQDGRRGALMLTLDVHHPEIIKFCKVKTDNKSVTGANLSTKLSDEFLQAVDENREYEQRWPCKSKTPKFSRLIKAKEVWDTIIDCAWQRAEPGILFWDLILRESPSSCYAELCPICVNPCFAKENLLLTKNGYVSFEDLYQNNTNNEVFTDNRISFYGQDENPNNWKIDLSQSGMTLRNASPVKITQKSADLYKLSTDLGLELILTKDHHLATTAGMIEAKDLTANHEILIPIGNHCNDVDINKELSTLEKLAFLVGLVAGDGTFSPKANIIHIDLWGTDKDRMSDICEKFLDELYVECPIEFKNCRKHIQYKPFYKTNYTKNDKIRLSSIWLCKWLNHIWNFNHLTKLEVPKYILNHSRKSVALYYLAGLFYADGSVMGSDDSGYSVRLNQNNKTLLQQCQLLLLSNGIITKLYKRRDVVEKTIKGKKYICQPNYELITINGSYIQFAKSIGFLGHIEKESKLQNIAIRKQNYKSKTIYAHLTDFQYVKTEEVYCLQEPITKSIIVNGIATRRCGEINEGANDSCRLLLLNLYAYVKNIFTKDAYFDYYEFYNDAKIAQRLADDLIDLEVECVERIIKKVEKDEEDEETKAVELNLWNKVKDIAQKGRRTGTGVTAIGGALAGLGVAYGSQEGIDVVERIYKTLKFGAYRSSVDMAKELGPFPLWNADAEKDCDFLNRFNNESVVLMNENLICDFLGHPEPYVFGNILYKDMQRYGRRNVALLTTAPCGTVSLMAEVKHPVHGTESGIEPAIFISCTRRRKINPSDKHARVDFVDQSGDSWQNYDVFHPPVKVWKEITGETDLTKSPWHQNLAEELDWTLRVKLQAAAQRHVDHSISATINLPEDVTREEVAKIYLTSWKSGCKGMTIYRKNCRSGVIIEKEDSKKPKIKKNEAPKRPEQLPCEIHRTVVDHTEYFVIVGLLAGEPYEVFAGQNIDVTDEDGLKRRIPTKIKTGLIKKAKRGHYNLIVENEVVCDNIADHISDADEAIARLISTSLRHGTSIAFICDQLSKIKGNMKSFAKVIARILKKYIPNGTKTQGFTCPNCESDNISYIEGCKQCNGCGWMACN